MLEALLHVQLVCPWMSELKKHVSSLKIISCRPVYRSGGASAVVSFRSSSDATQLQSNVSKLPHVVKAEFKKIGKNNGVGLVTSLMCPCSRIGMPNSHVLKIFVEDGWLSFHMLLSSKQELEEIVNRIKNLGLKYRLERIRSFKPRVFLTPRQEQVLVHAFIKGYFNYPRPATVNELAKEFGVSTPTYAELLRRALAKLTLMAVTQHKIHI